MKSYKKRFAEAEATIQKLEAQAKNLREEWIKAQQEKSSGMANGLELAKLKKQLEIVRLISAGEGSKAIIELLQPMPVVIGLDIRFADDKTREERE